LTSIAPVHCLPISLVVTTYKTDTLYTQACLESIRKWKNHHHQLIVVSHDESPLLRAYLDASSSDGLIDRLVYAVPGHGHTRSFNLAVRYSAADVVFNICNDILIGPSIVDHCAWQLRSDERLGLLGWHWYSEGTVWRDGRVIEHSLRDPRKPNVTSHEEECIRRAQWFTGRLFDSLGGPVWLQLCNTSFFGARRNTLDKVGGGFGKEFPHYWADDFLNYAVLDQGLDVRNFPREFRSKEFFSEFQYCQTDVQDRRRHEDSVRLTDPFLDSIRLYQGGMSVAESVYLFLLAKSIPAGSAVTNLGVWKGASAIVLLDALKDKQIRFHFIDCFDLPGVSSNSGQPPATQEEFLRNISPYIRPQHTIHMEKANSLDLESLPSSDFVFVDAGHTQKCIRHDARLVQKCLKSRGIAVFHDYGQPLWPAVKPELDEVYSPLEVHGTVAVYRRQYPTREEFRWSE